MFELLLFAVALLLFIAWKVAHIAKRCDQFWKMQGAMAGPFYDTLLERSEHAEKSLAVVADTVDALDSVVNELHEWASDWRDGQLEQEMNEAIERERWVLPPADAE